MISQFSLQRIRNMLLFNIDNIMFLGWVRLFFVIDFHEANFRNNLFIAIETQINANKTKNELKINY